MQLKPFQPGLKGLHQISIRQGKRLLNPSKNIIRQSGDQWLMDHSIKQSFGTILG